MGLRIEGHFLTVDQHQGFVTQMGEPDASRVLVCLPSVFEEMNLCRAIVAKQAQAFVKQGYCVYVIDYLGTGDSEGEIEDFTADDWAEQVTQTLSWIVTRHPSSNLELWGVRFGAALLLSQLTKWVERYSVQRCLLWKPVLSGKQFMSQFLRIKSANEMMQGNSAKINWRQHILDGNQTEVAGYSLTAGLVSSFDNLSADIASLHPLPVAWVETGNEKITPAMQKYVDGFGADNVSIRFADVPSFWQIPEIFDLPEMYLATQTTMESK